MNGKNITKGRGKLRVLVAPLDWGLGHATRCIPVIHALLKQDVAVFLAGENAVANLLQKEFPGLTVLPLKGYNVRYGKSRNALLFRMAAQFPAICSVVRAENRWLERVVEELKIDAVISDNRFGLYNKKIRSVYITHQLSIQTGNRFLNRLAQKIHYRYINRFDECWVPDNKGDINLAGALSHPSTAPRCLLSYTGCLSRFTKSKAAKPEGLLILLSGPEPQRTIFENILLQQILRFPEKKIILVRGKPGEEPVPACKHSNLQVFNHLPAFSLGILIQQAEIVIARAGYSTIMDLVTLEKKAILVPTPGQPEQEYLAGYLNGLHLFHTANQEHLNLVEELAMAAGFADPIIPIPAGSAASLNSIVDTFIKALISA